jgi:hypothetical protein
VPGPEQGLVLPLEQVQVLCMVPVQMVLQVQPLPVESLPAHCCGPCVDASSPATAATGDTWGGSVVSDQSWQAGSLKVQTAGGREVQPVT